MKKVIKYLVIIVVIFSCKPENRKDCFKSNGSIKTITRELEPFNEVVLNDFIEYEIIPFNGYKIEITAGENLFSNIESSVINYSLTIENKNKCNFVRGYKHHPSIKIFMPQINKLYHQGLGNVYINSNFNQELIEIFGQNSGDVYLEGNYSKVRSSSHGNTNVHFNGIAKELAIYMKGTNMLYAESAIVTEKISVTNISIGDVYLSAQPTTSFLINIERDGNIYYKGNPVDIEDNSPGNQKGKLIKND